MLMIALPFSYCAGERQEGDARSGVSAAAEPKAILMVPAVALNQGRDEFGSASLSVVATAPGPLEVALPRPFSTIAVAVATASGAAAIFQAAIPLTLAALPLVDQELLDFKTSRAQQVADLAQSRADAEMELQTILASLPRSFSPSLCDIVARYAGSTWEPTR